MKFKPIFQIFILFVLTFSVLGVNPSVQAKASTDAVIVLRDLTYWDATYTGNVSVSRYEKWSFQFNETNTFTITAAPTSGDLVPAISLLDVNGNEVSTQSNSLTVTQPAGSYYILIQPQAGSGAYNLTIRKTTPPVVEPSASVTANPPNVNVGETSVVTVSLNNTSAEGFTSAEFSCTYDPAVVEVSNIVETGLFGADAVMVVNGPANGAFIVALAGSNGKRATTSGSVFTFTAKGLQAGQTSVACAARVSKGDKTLTQITSTPAALNILIPKGTLTGQVTATKPVTVRVYDASNVVVESISVNADGTFSQPLTTGAYTVTASAEGFLGAQGSATITAGTTTTLPAISLLAGDIDGNNVIDQYDAMTIGMSYNASTPTAADLNNDNIINVLDLEMLAANYHKTGSLAWQ